MFGKVQATFLASRLSNTRGLPKNRSVLRSDTVERTRLPQPSLLLNTLLGARVRAPEQFVVLVAPPDPAPAYPYM